MHKKVLKQIDKDLDYLKTHDPARYKEAEEHLGELEGFTSVSRTSDEDRRLYGKSSAMGKVRER